MANTSWSVDVEVASASEPTSVELERWMADLSAHAPDIGAAEGKRSDGSALLTVTVTIDADTLGEAASRALDLVARVTGGDAIGVMAFEQSEYEAHVEVPFVYRRPSHSLIGYGDIANIAGA